MSLPPIPLPALVKAYREQLKITQQELGARITPTISRSAIAHLEQGLRIPVGSVVRRICETLNIPSALWEPFTAPGFSGKPGAELESESKIVAMAGVMGSGKTTLARTLSDILGFARLPEAALGMSYLDDVAADPNRWAFEAQLAFLCHKALMIRELSQRGRSLILDRSLSEDINVFAYHFHEKGQIDSRSFKTYSVLARHFDETLPPPDLVIYCKCSVDEALRRIATRKRGDRLHSRPHLEEIAKLYEKWLIDKNQTELLIVDSEKTDFRDPIAAQPIAQQVISHLLGVPEAAQLPLFPDLVPGAASPIRRRRPALEVSAGTPTIYLAAPFTAKSELAKSPEDLFDPPHGVIAPGAFRSALLAIEKLVVSWGARVIIPHRDVNKWGKLSLSEIDAARLCTDHVLGCDGIIALLGASHGAHYELGLAVALGRPAVVVDCAELGTSFIGRGLAHTETSATLPLTCQRISQLGRLLNTNRVREFLSRHMPLVPKKE